jgi:hypothetical protein
MLAPLLGALEFRCNNSAYRPVLDAIDLLAHYAGADREHAEVSMLALHLLQSSLVLINTQLLQAVLRDPQWAGKLTAADRRGLSPLFWSHVNPYLDMLQTCYLPGSAKRRVNSLRCRKPVDEIVAVGRDLVLVLHAVGSRNQLFSAAPDQAVPLKCCGSGLVAHESDCARLGNS